MLGTDDLVDRFLGGRLEHPERVAREIDREDEMLRHGMVQASGDIAAARVAYMAQGLAVLQSIRQLVGWRFGGWDGVGAVLDFAAGFGRVTRMLCHDTPAERVWASEIDTAGMRFLRDTLGVRILATAPDPSAVAWSRRFDLILVSSLFSHLPEELFHAWLGHLASALSPGGLLAFSVHDEALLPAGEAIPRSGIRYAPTSESRSLDGRIYGTTWVSERFVRRAAGRAAPGQVCVRFPRGHAGYQDLYAIVESEVTTPGPVPRLDPGPEGYIDTFEVDHVADCATIGGWSIDRVTGEAPAAVVVEIDGAGFERIDAFHSRPDVARSVPGRRAERCGFGFKLPLSLLVERGPVFVLIEAVSAAGSRSLLFAGTTPALALRVERLHRGVAG